MENSKRFADHMMQLRIKDVTDAGLDTGSGTIQIAEVSPGRTFNAWVDGHSDYLIITVHVGWGDVQQGVVLTETPCNFGGTRKWFICPNCGRRCGVLYVGKNIACRKCHDLAYASQNEAPRERMRRQLLKIRQAIGAGMEIDGPFSPPPPGMSKRHWLALIAEYKKLRTKYYREGENPGKWRNDAPRAAHWQLKTRIPSSRLQSVYV